MSPTQIITLTILFAYFAFLVALNWREKSGSNKESYAIGGRNVGYIATTGSLAAGIRDGAGLVLWISFGYTQGYAGLWLFVGIFTSFCLIALFGPRARQISIKRHYLTINQMLRDDVGLYTEKLVTLMMLVAALLVMAIQIYVAGNFFATLLAQPAWLGMVSVALVVGFYLFAGGYSAVVRTDTIQFFLIISLIIIPFFVPPAKTDMMNFQSFFSMGPVNSLAFFLIGMGYPLAGGDIWQRIFSARSANVIRVSFPMAAPALVVMTLSLIFLGFGIKQYLPDADPKEALYAFYKAELVSPYILSYIAVVVMAITMSTLDTQTYLFTSTAIKNIMPPSVAQDSDRYVHWARCVLIGGLAFTTFIALAISDIIQFLFETVSLLYVLAPIFAFSGMGLFKRSTVGDRLMAVNVLFSSGAFLWLFTNKVLEEHLIMTMLPAGISLLGCIIIAVAQKTGALGRAQS